MNARPSGGFGGLGLVQLMAPSGPTAGTPDGTNTKLDDNIIIRDGQEIKTGAFKQRYIGWRGMPDENGLFVDDGGNEVKLGDNEGDIRPAPLLMPAPYGRKSRVRSIWVDLGAAARRMTPLGGDGNPRGVDVQSGLNIGDEYGPLLEFSGVVSGPDGDVQSGFVGVVDDNVGGVRIDYPTVIGGLEVASIKIDVPYRGQSVIEVTLRNASAKLGADHNRYSHYVASVVESGATLGQLRILGHTGSTLYLSTESGTLPAFTAGVRAIQVNVLEKFFDIFTNGVEGFPQTFKGRDGDNERIPRSNVRIRFALHQNPKSSTAKRYPPVEAGKPLQYFSDWGNVARIEQIRKDGYRFVMYDILFDTQYEWDPNNYPNSNSLSPDTPLPEIRRLVLPYRY
jgi:hypothetical protein